MARSVALVLLLSAYGFCMETRETVERMVMVRTTGSDLQPAATGYIYKKESDGPASVVKMGESEVMEHLSKIYEQPKSFAAPIPVAAGPFYAKDDEDKAAFQSSESKVIPVVENQDENDDKIDGIADEDYGQIAGAYASGFDDYKSDFDEYLKSLGYFEDGLYHEHGDGKDYGSKGNYAHGDSENKGFGIKSNHEKGSDDDYHSEKYESFKISGNEGNKKEYGDADSNGKHFALGHGYKEGNHGYKSDQNKEGGVEGFHKLFDKDEFKKDHDFYDGEAFKGGFHKFAEGHNHHGSDAEGFKKGSTHESGHNEADFGKTGFHDKESGEEDDVAHSAKEGEESSKHYHRGFGAEGGQYNSKSYGFEVKH